MISALIYSFSKKSFYLKWFTPARMTSYGIVDPVKIVSMGLCKKDITPLLTRWSYVFLALIHHHHHLITWGVILFSIRCCFITSSYKKSALGWIMAGCQIGKLTLFKGLSSKLDHWSKLCWWSQRVYGSGCAVFIMTIENQGGVSIRKTVLPGMAIPMLKIRRPNGRLIFNMEIAIRR